MTLARLNATTHPDPMWEVRLNNRFGYEGAVKMQRCGGSTTDLAYLWLVPKAGYGGSTAYLDRGELTDMITALTRLRDSIPAVCKECGQVKPS